MGVGGTWKSRGGRAIGSLALGLSAPLSLVLQIGCFFPFTHTNLVLAVSTVVSKL